LYNRGRILFWWWWWHWQLQWLNYA
jgi:hypothetical protein